MNLAEKIIQLEKAVTDLQSKRSLEDIILKSRFNVLGFYGNANGTALTKSFDDGVFKNKSLLIKSLRIIPYYSAASEDISLDDGVTVTSETIPLDTRINRVFDSYIGASASYLRLLINGSPVIFNVDSSGAVDLLPSDFMMDNIYSHHNMVSLLSIDCYFENLALVAGVTIPDVKVYLECYIY